MTTVLVKGQNLPWPDAELTVRVHHPGNVSTLLLDGDENPAPAAGELIRANRTDSPDNSPRAGGGVRWSAGPPPSVRIVPDALPGDVMTVRVLLSIDPTGPTLGGQPAPLVEMCGTGGVVATFVPEGLTTERALIVCDVYRRGTGWRVRAVGQGYDGGLPHLLAAHGIDAAPGPAPSTDPPSDPPTGVRDERVGPTVPPAGSTPPGTSPVERLAQRVGMIMEDASRSTASLRSTVAYAEDRLDRTLAELVADPSTRLGPHGDRARATAHGDHSAMIEEASRNHERDLAQLRAELTELEAALPPAMAAWSSPSWSSPSWSSPGPPSPARTVPAGPRSPALRIGTLTTDDAPGLDLPMLVGLPLSAPLWIDTATGDPAAAAGLLRSLGLRLLAAAPSGATRLSVVDLGGASPVPLLGLATTPEGQATGPAAAAEVLRALVRHADLVHMALRSGLPGALDDLADSAGRTQVLLVHDVPTGMSDDDLRLLINVVEVGAPVGIQVVLTGSDGALDHPGVTALLRSCRRVPCGPGGQLTDGYGGVAWDFTPDPGPDDDLLGRVLRRLNAD